MANLKEIRNRITSVSSTMQITSAMKMVSAAKLKKAQDAITAMRPYASTLTELIQNLSGALEGDVQNPYTEVREKKAVLIVAITSNRGLCGAFNANIIKKTRQLMTENYANQKVSLLTVGKKGSEILAKTNQVVSSHDALFDELTYSKVSEVAQQVMDQFEEKAYDEVVLVYNRFKNAATQIVQTEPFLPIVAVSETETASSADYIFEPSQEEIVNELLPKSLKMQFFKALRDSFASEHGARMTAMHKATDNATELRDQLKLTYNKARQAAITNEILEIVGGAEALNG
ncbi:ATP synthase F1 subunit gamma [Flavobacteriaceae bacterium]|jgi:F-type H+-transporting ATPase subunit gamma|nr:ATP synthase F1 subunit gamma [Flavobacteriaceae bacterium]MDC0916754.1 ATP synthase F1 subunit gamma [Flavobacteriaceae bacterium]MDC3330296.1 ATP synthase F1 subunit gamma [Flavobacteriaceae bacterium]